MLTFDPPPEQDALELLRESELPDVVEVGENDTYWITISRRTRLLTLKPKLPPGQGVPRVERITLSQMERYGLTPRQQAVARDALKLGAPPERPPERPPGSLCDCLRANAAFRSEAPAPEQLTLIESLPKNGPFNG